MLYTLHELASTLTQQIVPSAPNGTTPLIANMSILPATYPSGSDFHAGELLLTEVSPSFPQPLAFASNRNTGNQDAQGDAITIFETNEQGELTLIDYVFTGLNQIRGMQLFGPNSEFLIAGGYGGGGVAVFQRTGNGNGLELLARNTDLPTRTSFVSVN